MPATPDSPSHAPSSGAISLLTLVLTAIASATAAYTTSKIWAPGTLASAAFTPVLVAILKDVLARPAKVVTQAVPVRGVVRSSAGPTGTEVHGTASAPPPEPEREPDLDRVAQQGAISYHSSSPSTSARRWRLAIITGLLGFVIAALVFTVPELVAGKSIFGGGGETTYFGGSSKKSAPTQTTTAPARTVTIPPAATVTAPAPVTVTVPPAATTTVPAPAVPTPAVPTPGAPPPAPAPSGTGSGSPPTGAAVPISP
ncbi:hypothetical protein [Gaiella sp.]|uniref:hypothetical protein n=1 Tax=Gaiella sp. TaxID=2663207 RepID=UPI00398395E6